MNSLNGLRILFADDDKYFMRPTVDALESEGAIVERVTDGTAVIRYLQDNKERPPSVLILDIMMSTGDEIETEDSGRSTGVEVFNKIRTDMKLDLPIVVSTVVTDPNVLSSLKKDKRLAFLQKPFPSIDLIEAIESLLGQTENYAN